MRSIVILFAVLHSTAIFSQPKPPGLFRLIPILLAKMQREELSDFSNAQTVPSGDMLA